MNKSKKPLAVLSAAAVAGLIVSAVSTPVFAQSTAIVVNGKDSKAYEYNYSDLKTSAVAAIVGGTTDPGAKLYNDFLNRKSSIKAYYDDVKKSYIDFSVVAQAATDAVLSNTPFNFKAFTEAASTQTVALTTNKLVVDASGNVTTETPATTQVVVSSVSAITATDVTVTLPAGFDATAAADVNNYAISVNGAASVKPTAVTVAGSSAKLSVSLVGQSGALTVNGVAGNTVNGTDKFDFEKPAIASVQALDSKTIVVNYSEKVDNTALALANYTLYNVQTGSSDVLNAGAFVGTTAAFTDASQKSVKLTLTVAASTAGYPMNGLSNGNYMLYVTGVKDVAANTITANSNVTFAGTTTPATTGANLASSSFNAGSGLVTLNFDKTVTAAAATDDQVYFQVGANKVLLKGAADYNSITQVSATSISFVVNTTATTGTLSKINALGANPQVVLAAGAFTDGTNATLAGTSTPTLIASPVLNAVTYDENTNTAVFKFNKTIDVTSITSFATNFYVGGVDINDADLKFNNTVNGTDLSFTLSSVQAQTVEAAVRGGNLTASVTAGAVKDTDTTPNANVTATSSATLAVGTSYTKDATAPTVTSTVYNGDTGVLAITFNEPVRNLLGDYTTAGIGIYTDTNGVAGIQTAAVGTTAADTKLTDLSTATLAQSDFYTDVTATTPYTALTGVAESKTLYIKNAAVKTALDAVNFATTDAYVNFAVGSAKDANTNATTAVQAQKVTKVAVSNSSAVTTATTVSADNLGSVTVSFKNALGSVVMDSATATNLANYNLYLTANPLAKVQIKSITLNADNTAATLLLNAPLTASTGYSLTTSGIKTASGAVGDIAGTTAFPAETFTTATAEAATNLATDGTLVLTDKDNSGSVTAGDTIAMVFNEAVKLPAGFDVSKLTVSNNHSLGTSTVALSADAKTLTITVGSGATIVAGDTITLPTTITNYENTALDNSNKTTGVLTVAGNAAATIKSTVYSDTNADGLIDGGDTVVVTFNQNVALKSGKLASDLLDEFSIASSKIQSVVLSGDKATITLGSTITPSDVTTTLTLATSTGDIVNAWGTSADDATGVATSYTDTIAPTVKGFSYNTTTRTVTVSFSEAVNVTSGASSALAKLVAGKVSVANGSLGTIANITGGTLSTDGKSYSFVLDTDAALDQYSTVTVNAGALTDDGVTNVIKDASGNVAVRSQGTAYTLTITQ